MWWARYTWWKLDGIDIIPSLLHALPEKAIFLRLVVLVSRSHSFEKQNIKAQFLIMSWFLLLWSKKLSAIFLSDNDAQCAQRIQTEKRDNTFLCLKAIFLNDMFFRCQPNGRSALATSSSFPLCHLASSKIFRLFSGLWRFGVTINIKNENVLYVISIGWSDTNSSFTLYWHFMQPSELP